VVGIIHAAALLTKRFPDLRLIIAGEGPEEKKLKILVNKLGFNNNVDFLGYVSRAESWHISRCSQVYVLNAASEYFPYSVQKGFTAGIPIVAPDVPCFNEMIKDGESGVLVSPGDDNKLTEAISRLFNDQALCERIAKKARETLAEKFSWPAHIKKLCRLLNLTASDKK
jgi:glycosyltransferase involved in cell wall biosynthesis